MNTHNPHYREVNGDVLPNYSGEINGPRTPNGALMEEVETFLDNDEDLVDVEEKSKLVLRAEELARIAAETALDEIVARPHRAPLSVEGLTGEEVAEKFLENPDQFGHNWPSAQFNGRAKAAAVKVPELTGEDWLRLRREEREDDHAGTYPGTSPEPTEVSRSPVKSPKTKINPHTGKPTIASQNAAEAAHWRQAQRDRYGK